MNEEELRKRVRLLFWVIANQREKVHGSLHVLIKELYPEQTEESKAEILERIMKNINY